MKPIETKYMCPYCSRHWDTKELAKECAKSPEDLFKEGDVINWKDYKYGLVTNVDVGTGWAGFSASKNKDYCIALGYAPGDMFGRGQGESHCYAGFICGGKEKHDSILMTQEHIDDMVKGLEKKLAAAKRLQIKVTEMWAQREPNEITPARRGLKTRKGK